MTESIQKKLLRVRPPRVKITYDIETGGALEKKELPFVVGILSDLDGDIRPPKPALTERSFLEIDRDNFSEVMRTINPTLDLGSVANVLPGAKAGDMLSGTLSFTSMDHFMPLALIERVPVLNNLYAERKQILMQPGSDARIDVINGLINAQLNTIMHAPAFKKLEASWRGLYYLVSKTETGNMLKLRVWNVSKEELIEDFEKAVSFTVSALFKKIYEEEFGTYGGFPFSLLIGDFYFNNSQRDVSLLHAIAQVSAAAHAPLIAAADPSLFGVERFGDIIKIKNLANVFEGAAYQAFNEFRNSEDSRYVSLVLPPVLFRSPYGQDNNLTEGFCFEEEINADQQNLLFGNTAWLLAERITNAFSLYSWPAAIRGMEGGGLVEGLPLLITRNVQGVAAVSELTATHFTPTLEKQLEQFGFIMLNTIRGTTSAVFFGDRNKANPKQKTATEDGFNTHTHFQLPHLLAASRFALYIKVIMRNKIGSFLTRGNIESYLTTWISNYVLLDDNATADAEAGYPLRSAQVVVTEVAGSPGNYTATLFLKPHFQLEELTASIRLVVELAA